MGCINEKQKVISSRKVSPVEEFGLKRQDSENMFDRASPKGMISQHLKKRNQRNSNTTLQAETVNFLASLKDHQDKRTSVMTNMPFNFSSIMTMNAEQDNNTPLANMVQTEQQVI